MQPCAEISGYKVSIHLEFAQLSLFAQVSLFIALKTFSMDDDDVHLNSNLLCLQHLPAGKL